jgi:2-dehydropantoate 2-reductase
MLTIAIVPSGAVWAYFGGRLAQVGVQLRLLARGSHLQALQEYGLMVGSVAGGDFQLKPDQYFVSADAAEVVRGADLVLFAPKSFDTKEVATALLPGLGANIPVISLQNGVENEGWLSEILGANRVVAGVAYIEAWLDGPGMVKQRRMARLVLGKLTEAGQMWLQVAEFEQLCAQAGFGLEFGPDTATIKWSKLITISALSGWTTATRLKLDKILADSELREAFTATALETARIGVATGAKLDPEASVKGLLAVAEQIGDMGSSMLFDAEHGKRIEVEALNGAVVRQGRALGLTTPYNQTLYALLRSKYVV